MSTFNNFVNLFIDVWKHNHSDPVRRPGAEPGRAGGSVALGTAGDRCAELLLPS